MLLNKIHANKEAQEKAIREAMDRHPNAERPAYTVNRVEQNKIISVLQKVKAVDAIHIAIFQVMCGNWRPTINVEDLRIALQRQMSATIEPKVLERKLQELIKILSVMGLAIYIVRERSMGEKIERLVLTPGKNSRPYVWYTIDEAWAMRSKENNAPLPTAAAYDLTDNHLSMFAKNIEGKDLVGERGAALSQYRSGLYTLHAGDNPAILVTANKLESLVPQLRKIIRIAIQSHDDLLDALITKFKKGANDKKWIKEQLSGESNSFWLGITKALTELAPQLKLKHEYKILETYGFFQAAHILHVYEDKTLKEQQRREKERQKVLAFTQHVVEEICVKNRPSAKQDLLTAVQKSLKDNQEWLDIFYEIFNTTIYNAKQDKPSHKIYDFGAWYVPGTFFKTEFSDQLRDLQQKCLAYYAERMGHVINGESGDELSSLARFNTDLFTQAFKRNRHITKMITEEQDALQAMIALNAQGNKYMTDSIFNEGEDKQYMKLRPLAEILNINIAKIAKEAYQQLPFSMLVRLAWYKLFFPKVPYYLRNAEWQKRKQQKKARARVHERQKPEMTVAKVQKKQPLVPFIDPKLKAAMDEKVAAFKEKQRKIDSSSS